MKDTKSLFRILELWESSKFEITHILEYLLHYISRIYSVRILSAFCRLYTFYQQQYMAFELCKQTYGLLGSKSYMLYILDW